MDLREGSTVTKNKSLEDLFAAPGATDTAIRICRRISKKWNLDEVEESKLLGVPAQTTPVSSPELLERLSYILGIYKNLRFIFTTEQRASGWIRRPNDAFDGKTALDVMMEDPAIVRRYLDAQADGAL